MAFSDKDRGIPPKSDDKQRGLSPPITNQQRGIAPSRMPPPLGPMTAQAYVATPRPAGSCPSPMDDTEIAVPGQSADAEDRLSNKEASDANGISISFEWAPVSSDKTGKRRSEKLYVRYDAEEYSNSYQWMYDEVIVTDARGIR